MENFSVLIGLGFLNRMSRMTHICMLWGVGYASYSSDAS